MGFCKAQVVPFARTELGRSEEEAEPNGTLDMVKTENIQSTSSIITVIHAKCKANNAHQWDTAGDCTQYSHMVSVANMRDYTASTARTIERHSWSYSALFSVILYFLREISAAMRMSFQMVIKPLLVTLCVFVCATCMCVLSNEPRTLHN